MIELLRSILEYFSVKRLLIAFIADAAIIVFVLREGVIKLFEHTTTPGEIYTARALLNERRHFLRNPTGRPSLF